MLKHANQNSPKVLCKKPIVNHIKHIKNRFSGDFSSTQPRISRNPSKIFGQFRTGGISGNFSVIKSSVTIELVNKEYDLTPQS